MCENCFISEISSFPDEKSWSSFDFELTKKLGQAKMKNVKFVHDGKYDKDDGQYIYECLTCGEKWKLKKPDNAFRGFFIKGSSIDKLKATLTIGQIIGLIFLGLIVIRIVYGLLT